MLRRWSPLVGSRYRVRHLLSAILVCVLLSYTLSSLRTRLGPSSSASNDERPHYLHHSPFRARPNRDFESQASSALQYLEEQERTLHGSVGTPDTIWQIYLGKEPTPERRGEDSLRFEERNAEWDYKVSDNLGVVDIPPCCFEAHLYLSAHAYAFSFFLQLVTTEWANEFITVTLSSIPGLAHLYYSYPHHVLRADLLRYLVLWYYGGYYADMDVFPKRTIKKCPSLQKSVFSAEQLDISLVIGLEIDEPFASPKKMHDWHWVRRYGFIQYNIYAPQRFSPILRELIVRVLSHTKSHLDQSSIFFGPRYDEKSTLEITGPGVFTDTVLDVLSSTLPASHPLIRESIDADEEFGDLILPGSPAPTHRVTWAPFYRLSEPLCVDAAEAKSGSQLGGLCVLPINAWGNGQRHSGAENFFSDHACINHRFGGTWKPWKQSWKKKLFG